MKKIQEHKTYKIGPENTVYIDVGVEDYDIDSISHSVPNIRCIV